MLCPVSVIFVVASVELKTNYRAPDRDLMQIIVFKAARDYQRPNSNGSNRAVLLCYVYVLL